MSLRDSINGSTKIWTSEGVLWADCAEYSSGKDYFEATTTEVSPRGGLRCSSRCLSRNEVS